MIENPEYIRWRDAYTGTTDNGVKLPIEMVIPGACIHGGAVGYWPAESVEQALKAWEYLWFRITTETDPARSFTTHTI